MAKLKVGNPKYHTRAAPAETLKPRVFVFRSDKKKIENVVKCS